MAEPLQRALANALEQTIVRQSAQDGDYSGPRLLSDSPVQAVVDVSGDGYGYAEPFYETALLARRPATTADDSETQTLVPRDKAVRVTTWAVSLEAPNLSGDPGESGAVFQREIQVEGLTTDQPIPVGSVAMKRDDAKTYIFGPGSRLLESSGGFDVSSGFPEDSRGFIYRGAFGTDDTVRGVYPPGHALTAVLQFRDWPDNFDVSVSVYVGGLIVPPNSGIPPA